MMGIDAVRSLYDYSYWATGRVLAAAQAVTAEQFSAPAPIPFPFDDLRSTLVHMLDTERNARFAFQSLPRPSTLQSADFASAAELAALWREEETAMRAYLDGLTDADLAAPYDLGARGTLPVWELLLHFANHSTQHRSEAAILLTHFGHSPQDLDYFYYAMIREGHDS